MHQGCAFPFFPSSSPNFFSRVLVAGLSSLASLDRAIPNRGKHGSPPTWPWNAWTFSRGNWEWGTSGVSEGACRM